MILLFKVPYYDRAVLIEGSAQCCCVKSEARGQALAQWSLAETRLQIHLPAETQQTDGEQQTPPPWHFISSCIIQLGRHPTDDVKQL